MTLDAASPAPQPTGTSVATVSQWLGPAPAPAAPDSPWLTAAFFAAIITALVTVVLARRRHLEEERSRLTETFAGATRAVAAYKEMPYAIRRRNHLEGPAERVRLSQEMAQTQADLSYYLAWTAAESENVGHSYAALVAELRRVAGRSCHDAWLEPPPTRDEEMNIPPSVVDLSPIQPFETAFAAAAKEHLDAYLTWRALLRRP